MNALLGNARALVVSHLTSTLSISKVVNDVINVDDALVSQHFGIEPLGLKNLSCLIDHFVSENYLFFQLVDLLIFEFHSDIHFLASNVVVHILNDLGAFSKHEVQDFYV